MRNGAVLVYRDEAGTLHEQDITTVPEIGTLTDPDTGEDMNVIGWSNGTAAGTVRTSDMYLVYQANGTHHAQHWTDVVSQGGLTDEEGDDMDVVGYVTKLSDLPDDEPESCCAGCDCGESCAADCEVGPVCPDAPHTKDAAPSDGGYAQACAQCGEPFETDANEVSYHVTVDGESDHDADADHVPYAENTDFGTHSSTPDPDDGLVYTSYEESKAALEDFLKDSDDGDDGEPDAWDRSREEWINDELDDALEAVYQEGRAACDRDDSRAPAVNAVVTGYLEKFRFAVGDERGQRLMQRFAKGYQDRIDEQLLDWESKEDNPSVYPVTEQVVCLPPRHDDEDYHADPEERLIELDALDGVRPAGTMIAEPPEMLVKFTHRGGKPSLAATFNWQNKKWGDTHSVLAGVGKCHLDEAQRLKPERRAVPKHVAEAYGQCGGNVCLVCGRTIKDPRSCTRGVGPECARRSGY